MWACQVSGRIWSVSMKKLASLGWGQEREAVPKSTRDMTSRLVRILAALPPCLLVAVSFLSLPGCNVF